MGVNKGLRLNSVLSESNWMKMGNVSGVTGWNNYYHCNKLFLKYLEDIYGSGTPVSFFHLV